MVVDIVDIVDSVDIVDISSRSRSRGGVSWRKKAELLTPGHCGPAHSSSPELSLSVPEHTW